MAAARRACAVALFVAMVVLAVACSGSFSSSAEEIRSKQKRRMSGIIIPGFASTQLRAWSILDCPYSPLDFNPLDLVWLDTTKVKFPPTLSLSPAFLQSSLSFGVSFAGHFLSFICLRAAADRPPKTIQGIRGRLRFLFGKIWILTLIWSEDVNLAVFHCSCCARRFCIACYAFLVAEERASALAQTRKKLKVRFYILQLLSAVNCWLKCMLLDPYNQTDHPECKSRPDSGLSAVTELDPGYITGTASFCSIETSSVIIAFQLDV